MVFQVTLWAVQSVPGGFMRVTGAFQGRGVPEDFRDVLGYSRGFSGVPGFQRDRRAFQGGLRDVPVSFSSIP